MDSARVMIVEDEASVAVDLRQRLMRLGYSVTSITASGEESIPRAEAERPDIVLMDIRLRDEMDGVEAARQIHADFDIPVVFLTAYSDSELLDRARTVGSFGYLIKPFDERELQATLEMALYKAKAERELRREKELSEKYINSLPGLFYVFDEARFVKWNRMWNEITGYSDEELGEMYGTDFFADEDRAFIGKQMQQVFSEGVSAAEAVLLTKDGRRIPYYFTGLRMDLGGKAHLIGMGVDITERKRAEEEKLALERQVLHAQKLESLGVLAGGIAHDFNNLLMVMLGYAGLIMADLSPMSPVRSSVKEIEKAAKRAAALANQMLAYSGKGRFVVEPIQLGQLIEEMAHLIDVSISKKAVLKYRFAEDIPSFDGDAPQIRQVIMNIVTNASEAIEDENGVIVLSTGAMDCDRAYLDDVNWGMSAGLEEPLPEGIYTFVEVADTGCGMDEEAKGKLFEPFFSTKFTGRGLGMAAVLGIVRGHDGAIRIQSKVGEGTTLRILFPARKPGEENDSGIEGNGEDKAEKWRGSGTILIVDDEESVCAVGKQTLRRMGFSVLTAPDGCEAVETFRKHADEIVCVLLDMTMPQMDGEQAFYELQHICPDVKVILCSGYSMQDATQHFSGEDLAGFLQKPYTAAVLRGKLQEVLSAEK